MHETSARGWCTGKTQRDGMGREAGGGIGMGNTCNPWLIHVSVWQKPLQYCKVISLQLIKINEKKMVMELGMNKEQRILFLKKCIFSVHHIRRHFVIVGDIQQISPFTKYKYLCIISTLLIGVLHWDPVSILFSYQLLLSDSIHWEASLESIIIIIWWFSVSVTLSQTTETFST